jgi:hypothetical protein
LQKAQHVWLIFVHAKLLALKPLSIENVANKKLTVFFKFLLNFLWPKPAFSHIEILASMADS